MFRNMAKIFPLFLATVLLTACGKPPEPPAKPSTLTEAEKDVLAQYDAVRANLAADDFEGAKEASKALADIALASKGKAGELEAPSRELAAAANIKDARVVFTKVSAAAISMVQDEPGYYVIECGMYDKGDWVQTTTKLANPYWGKQMLECGTIKNIKQ